MAKKEEKKGRVHIDTVKEELPKIYKIPRFIEEDEVLQLTNRGWYIGGRRLSDEEKSALKAEAKEFERSYLWKVMRRDIHYTAYLQSTAKRSTELDAIYGGAMYRDLQILEIFLKRCGSL